MKTYGAKVINESVVLLAPKFYDADTQTVADLCETILSSRPYDGTSARDAALPKTRSPLVAAKTLGYTPSANSRRLCGYAR